MILSILELRAQRSSFRWELMKFALKKKSLIELGPKFVHSKH